MESKDLPEKKTILFIVIVVSLTVAFLSVVRCTRGTEMSIALDACKNSIAIRYGNDTKTNIDDKIINPDKYYDSVISCQKGVLEYFSK